MEVDSSWNILDAYFHDHVYPFTKHHLDSFKQFMKVHIPDTIAHYNPITMIKFGASEENEAVKVEVYIGGVGEKLAIYIDRPTSFDEDAKSILLTPNETRLRNITYSTKLYADIDVVYSKDGEHYKTVQFKHILLGSIPLMLHSDQCILHAQGSKVIRGLSECPMDGGGYFIIDGKEKVIISQERITTNTLFVEKIEDPDLFYKATIRCTGSSGESSLIPKVLQIIVINPKPRMSDNKNASDDLEEVGYKSIRGGIFVSVQGFNSIFPLTTLFRAIGFETDKSIVEAICGTDTTEDNLILREYMNFLRPSIVHGNSIKMKDSDGHAIFLKTMNDAHLNLKPRTYFKSIQQVKSILTLDFLPNIENGGLREKGIYLGYLVRQVLNTILHIRTVSDRDSYEFKRVDISGYLLSQLFQETYSKFRKHIRNELDKYYKFGHIETTGKIDELITKSNINRIFTPVFITDTFTRSLKGMWGQPTDDPEQGLVQDLSRISYIGFLSHLRRVNIPLDRSIKIRSPHTLHPNQWGRFCPFETPDGAAVGYLKNLAILTQISSGTAAATLFPLLEELNVVLLKNVAIYYITKSILVFINGGLYGVTDKPELLVRVIRLYRRNGLINPFISISWNIKLNEIQIHTEAGRPMRPLLIIDDGKVLADNIKSTKWYDMLYGSHISDSYKNENAYYDDKLLSDITNERSIEEALKLLQNSQGCIEYLDVEEENTMLIAVDRKDIGGYHTHIEINPITLFSVVTQLVPLLNHNQSPRVVFHAAQCKQAIGIYATNFTQRFDTMGYIQHYPQRRVIATRGSHYNGANLMPNGTNCIVAIMTHTGFNQEDSVMINKGAIDRGLYHVTAYKTMSAIEKTLSPNDRLVFANPIEWRKSGKVVKNIKHADYTLLDKDGFIKEGSYIPKGREVVIIGMIHVHQSVKMVNKGVLTDKELVEIYTDVSLVTDVHHYGHIDKIFVGNQIPGIERNDVSRVCKVRFRKIRRPELGDKNCLTPEHEVLTTSGWKFIDKITLNDEVYTLDSDGSIKIDKPTKLYEVDCVNEKLYDLHSQQVDLRVTMDHNMYVKTRNSETYEIIKAKDIIGKRVCYSKAGINTNSDYDSLDFTGITLENLPDWVWKLSQKQSIELFNKLIGTDIFNTSSKKVADDLQRLALHCGWFANIYSNTEIYLVDFIREMYDTDFAENIIDYTGKVYCIEVPTHVFYVRKNGKPVWTGNCSAHGQKGVIGLIIPEQDMPFSKDGIRPDIIINPHAIPSRMTIGHLIETVFAKLSCMEGTIGDGTVFLPFDKTAMYDSLEKYGYEKHGNEILYNSRNGHQIDTEIFMGPIYYYRLKHMVTDKIHARDKGPKSQMTRQPTSGRSKHGGLRLGEMERDVVLSHGISQFIKEGWMERSDKFKWAICRYCGIMALYGPFISECKKCKREDIVLIETPYAFKLLIQELECLGLQVRLSPDESPPKEDDLFETESSSDSDESLPGIIESESSESSESEESEESEEFQKPDTESEKESEKESDDESEASETSEEVKEPEIIENSTLNSEMSGGNNNVPEAIYINELIDDNLDVNLPVLTGGNAPVMSSLTENGASVAPVAVPQNFSPSVVSAPVVENTENTRVITIDMKGGRLPEPTEKSDEGQEDDMDFFA